MTQLPPNRRKSLVVAVAFVAMVVLLVTSEQTGAAGWYQCPIRWATGYSCFGCGMTRATKAALLGDFGASVYFHPMGIPFLAGFGAVALNSAWEAAAGRKALWGPVVWVRRREKLVWLGVLIFVVVFGALRFSLEWAGILTPV